MDLKNFRFSPAKISLYALFLVHTLTLDLLPWILVTQVVQCVTIITSCIPYLRQLLEGILSGMFLSDELRRREFRDTGSAGERRKWLSGVLSLKGLLGRTNNNKGSEKSKASGTTILKTTRLSTRSDNIEYTPRLSERCFG